MIAGGLSLSLPPGWHASSDASGESDWILLCRSADSRSILRVMEITTGYNLSGPKLAAYYAANYLKDQELLENASVSVGGNAFHVFISQSPSSGTVLSAFLLDRPGQVVFFEEITHLEPSDARKDFLAILGSCRRRPVGESGRRIAGLLDFFSMDGSWVWLYDEKDGIRVAGRLGEDVVTLAVLRVVAGIDPLAKAPAGTADAIQATLLISDSAIPVQVRDMASEELRSLWIDMTPSGISFQAVLEPVGGTDTVETLLNRVELKKLFSRDLVLGGL